MFAEAVALISIGVYVYHRWIEDHPPAPVPPQLQLPRTAEGTPLPLVYGQCRLRSPVVVWAGNYLKPGDTYTPWNPFNPGDTGATDHYSVDVLLCLGIPFYATTAAGGFTASSIRGAWAGDSQMNLAVGTATGGTGAQAVYSHFSGAGGDPKVFSLTGVYYRGASDQNVLDKASVVPPLIPNGGAGFFPDNIAYDVQHDVNTGTSFYAVARQANAHNSIPGCRNQMMLFAHVALGGSTSLPAFQFEVLSTQTNSQSDFGNSFTFDEAGTQFDADPAAVIFDILTSPWGKLGLSITTALSQINIPSFEAASNTLFAEQHGYSRAFEQAADADAMIRDVLAQIDGGIYQEPTTGQLTIYLVRFNYDPTTLDDINPSNAETPGAGWYTVQGWAEVPNQVRVTYLDRSNGYAETVAIAQDPSLIDSNGGRIRSVSLRFDGCCVAATAGRIAARELAAVGRPMVRATVLVSRAFYAKRPGDVVTLTWPDLGINKMVMRIAAIDFGMQGNGKIKMSLMRDSFDVQIGAF